MKRKTIKMKQTYVDPQVSIGTQPTQASSEMQKMSVPNGQGLNMTTISQETNNQTQ
jgi:hypothetical protein